jgi:hypothetical protein
MDIESGNATRGILIGLVAGVIAWLFLIFLIALAVHRGDLSVLWS